MAEVGQAWVSILPETRKFGSTLSKQIGPEATKAGKSFGSRFGSALKIGAVAGGAVLGGFLKGSLDEAREAQKVGALTNAVIKSTGGVANVTAKDVDRLATSISLKTGIDDEAIAAGQNMLLTFSKVRNEVGKGNAIFNQATVAATDMAAAFGGDAVSNSKILGKALNDPTKGVSALTRVGVTFTEQQKKQIAAMQKTGNVVGAQKVILAELSKQTAGAAAAMASPADKARVAFGNLQEQVGTALLPVVDRFHGLMSRQVIPAVSTFVTQVQTGTGVGGQLATAFGTVAGVLGSTARFVNNNRTAFAAFGVGVVALNLVMKAHAVSMAVAALGMKGYLVQTKIGAVVAKGFAAAQWLVNVALTANPIGLVVAAIAALVVGLVIAYKKSETFRKIVTTGLDVVMGAAQALGSAFMDTVGKIGEFVSAGIDKIGNFLSFVRDVPGKVKDAFGAFGSLLFNAGQELIQGLIDGITAKLGALVAKMGEVADKIKGFLPGSPVREGPLRSWNDTGPNGPGGQLIGMLAAGLKNTDSLDSAMHRLSARVTIPRPDPSSYALAGSGGGVGASGGGRTAITITNWETGEGYMEQIAENRIRGWAHHDERMAGMSA